MASNPIVAMASNPIAMASNLLGIASDLRTMASNLRAMTSNLIAVAYNPVAMASKLIGMAAVQSSQMNTLHVPNQPIPHNVPTFQSSQHSSLQCIGQNHSDLALVLAVVRAESFDTS